MRSFRAWSNWVLVPALAALLTVGGCGKKKTDEKKGEPTPEETDKAKASTGDKGTTSTDKNEDKASTTKPGESPYVEGKGKATLAGTIKFEGAVPDRPEVVDPKNKDHAFCLMGDGKAQTWIVDKDKKTIANVVVYLAAPAGKHFNVNPAEPWWPKVVYLDQPHCAFEPHVVVAFASSYDAKAGEDVKNPSQKFEIRNSATISHNTNWKGGRKNPGGNVLLPPGMKGKPDTKTVEIAAEAKPIEVHCNIHPWMSAYVWAFDHPYAAVSQADGSYKIENIPAGVPLKVYYWHESFAKPKEGGEITFTEGENKKDFTVTK